MIFEDHIIVPVFIVISRIIKLSTGLTFDLFGLQTQEINFLEIKQFCLLKIGQFSRLRVQLKGLADGHRILNDGFLLGIGCQNVNNFFGGLLSFVDVCVLTVLAESLSCLLLAKVSTFEQGVCGFWEHYGILWAFFALRVHGGASVLGEVAGFV